jgi:crotonobetainyl-CoA:carnitine CoA-transferase CaiB-like acyl-CoA transferase
VLALDGVKVVDFTRVLSGPYCTMVLADLGADVLKVERFPGGDDSRRLGPHRNGESYCFAMANRNKRSIALDLKSQAGRDIALKLIGSADVVVENFRPGVTKRLGIDYEAVRADHPQLIYCSITGYGQTGPYRLRAGYDIIAQGITGFLRMTGQPDGRPAKVGIAINDIAAGATAVQAILAACIHRMRTDEGQYIDVSLVDSGLAWTIWESAAYFGSGELPQPTGTRHRRAAPYQAYRTSDGYVTAGGNNERLWERFCTQVMERPEWLEDPRYATLAGRLQHADELERDIESLTTTQPTAYWVDRLDAAGVPGGPVYTYDETLGDEHVLARGMVQEVEHPRLGPTRILGPAPKLSETPAEIRSAAPWLGQHSAQALAELGFTAAEIDELFDAGVVFDQARGVEDAKEQA